jgi:hypothetical protein
MTDGECLQCELREGGLVIRALNRDILEKMEVTVRAIATLLRTHRAKVALVDLRAVPGNATFMDRYQLGEQAGRHLPRIAIAALLRDEQSDPERIGQLTAQNRGMYLEVFTDETAAFAWLEKQLGRP